MIISGIRHRPGRTAALIGGIVVAAASFVVLAGASTAARLQVVGTVERQPRTPYDILVRPRGSATGLEAREGVVQRNFLSGTFGGITRRQLHAVEQVAGVEVAAPIALVGSILPDVTVPVRLAPVLGDGDRQLFRLRTTWTADRGLTRLHDADQYVYVTTRRMVPRLRYLATDNVPLTYEVMRSGRRVPVCPIDVVALPPKSPFAERARRQTFCWSRRNGLFGRGVVRPSPQNRVAQLGGAIPWPIPLLVAAIDPVAEARLSGLERTVVAGRYLREDDRPQVRGEGGELRRLAAPMLLPTETAIDQAAHVSVERLPGASGVLRQDSPRKLRRFLESKPRGREVSRHTIGAQDAYRTLRTRAGEFLDLTGYWTSGPVSYTQRAGREIAPRPVPSRSSVWQAPGADSGYVNTPITAQDTQFRRLRPHYARLDVSSQSPAIQLVGTFDPSRIPGFDDPRIQPLGTFNASSVAPAGARSAGLLAGRDLLPSANLGGYLTPPPLALTTLSSLPVFYGGERFADAASAGVAPISSIRVRVAGVTGIDALSRERIRSVAQMISQRTHLRVDITSGSSPTQMQVDLPPISATAPRLSVLEGWVKKGVALAVLKAVDRKSLVLFVLILVVCALAVANAAAAAVRARRADLGILAAVGWQSPSLFRLVLGEMSLIGALAGTIGALAAIPVTLLLDLDLSVSRVVLSVPIATVLAVLASLWPAIVAARTPPAFALQPPVVAARRARPSRTLPAMALANVLRVPGRSLLCMASLAVAVASLTVLLAILLAFHGALVGSLLGDAVALQVRGVDTVAVVIMVLLGAFAVADVLYLNVRDRANELAALSATGWHDREIATLITLEGMALGAAGSLAGAVLGLLGATTFAGGAPATVFLSAGFAALAGIGVSAAAATAPAMLVARLPMAIMLAEE